MIRPSSSAVSQHATNKSWNTVVLETDDFVLTPTLGSVVPNWLLLWPKQPYLSCLEWKGADADLDEVARNALSQLDAPMPDNYIWFEHGCAKHGSLTGCGVNHAHLHILLDPYFSLEQFHSTVEQFLEDQRSGKSISKTHASSFGGDYHCYGGNGKTHIPRGSGELGSQFFRKVVASLANETENWDYRKHPFEVNVQRTLDALTAG